MPAIVKVLQPDLLTAWKLAAISIRIRMKLMEAGLPVTELDVMQKILDSLVAEGILGE